MNKLEIARFIKLPKEREGRDHQLNKSILKEPLSFQVVTRFQSVFMTELYRFSPMRLGVTAPPLTRNLKDHVREVLGVYQEISSSYAELASLVAVCVPQHQTLLTFFGCDLIPILLRRAVCDMGILLQHQESPHCRCREAIRRVADFRFTVSVRSSKSAG